MDQAQAQTIEHARKMGEWQAKAEARDPAFHSPKNGPISLTNNPYAGDPEMAEAYVEAYLAAKA